MKGEGYSAPVIAELQTKDEAVAPAVPETQTVIANIASEVPLTSNQSFWRELVDKHFQYLSGKIGFSNDKQRQVEMISFMQQTGRMLKYAYPEMEDCVLYLIQKMRNEPEAIDDGRFFRYLKGCESAYSFEAIAQYRIFSTWCISIANSWPTRVKRALKTDIESLSKNMPEDARNNLNFFVRKMANYGIQ